LGVAKRTLYAYVSGTNHADIAAKVEARLDALVATRKWISKDVWVVNQEEPPAWDLGLNLVLPGPRSPTTWTDDVLAVATDLGALHRETGREFVIGIHDAKSDTTTDLFVVDSSEPDLEKLRAALLAK
jgi:hypothetical protein